MSQRVKMTASLRMKEDGQIEVQVEGQSVAHVSPTGQTDLYARLLAHLRSERVPLPIVVLGEE